MALNIEKIKANEALAGLTEDQLKAIVTLSQNDENAVIAAKTGEIHGAYDRDILEATGIEKEPGEKTYDYNKRAFAKLKQKADKSDLTKQIETLTAERDDLKKKVADGSQDEALKTQLADTQKRLTDLRSQFDKEKTEWDGKLKSAQQHMADIRVDHEFDKALQGIKFKDEKVIPAAVRNTYIDAAKRQIRAEATPDWTKNGDGKETLVFRDSNGMILNNPENLQSPYTAKDLLMSRIKDIIEVDRSGGGAGGAGGGKPKIVTLDLTGTQSQNEADDKISDYLAGKGVPYGSDEWATQHEKLWEENKETLGKLPIT